MSGSIDGLTRSSALALLALALSACSSGTEEEAVGSLSQATLCGGDDMQDVELYDGSQGPSQDFVARKATAVGVLRWRSDLASRYTNPGDVAGKSRCTGTLIARDLLLTAGHCFTPNAGQVFPTDNVTRKLISAEVAATEMVLVLGYQRAPSGATRPGTVFNVVQLVERQDTADLDYAVLRIEGNPGASFGYNIPSPFPLNAADAVTLIQHPLGQPKLISAGPVVAVAPTKLSYTADTESESSGSGVLSNRTGFLAAVHTDGECTDTGGFNWGGPIGNIWAVSPTVRTASFDASKLAAAF
jgi:hypothetical protein